MDRVHLSRIRCAGCFGQRFYFVIIRSVQAAHCQRPLASNLFERSAARGIAAAAAFCLIFAAGCADSLVRSNIPLGSHEFADKLTPCSAVRRGARWSTSNAVVAVQMGWGVQTGSKGGQCRKAWFIELLEHAMSVALGVRGCLHVLFVRC